MPDDTLPGRVGRFEIRRELGRGTMGVVFEAHDATLHRTVALKVIRLAFAASARERKDFEGRFLTEARAAAGLSHPGIVVVHEAGRDEASGMLYLALEHLVGQSLAEALAQRGRFEEQEALRIAAEVARALDYAHRRGVVHRDVKPANVMLLPDGAVKILDFGLAKVEAGHEQTAAGQFLGTPLFVSPEQALGRKVDGRSDLFSLGAILYTLLTGRRPFEGETLARILNRVAHQPPRSFREAGALVSQAAEAVTMRALAKDPDDRYPTGAAMAEALEDVRAGRSPRYGATPLAGVAREASARAGGEGGVQEGTVVAKAGDADDLPELVLEDASARGRRRPRIPLRALSLVLLLGGFAIYYRSISGPERLAEAIAPFFGSRHPPRRAAGGPAPEGTAASLPASPPATEADLLEPVAASPSADEPAATDASPPSASPLPSPTRESSEASAPSSSTEESASVAAPEPTSDDAPILLADEDEPASPPDSIPPAPAVPRGDPIQAPTPTPSVASPSVPSPRPTATPRPANSAKAELAIRLEHPLARGTVRVWLDDQLVLRAALSSTVSRKILFFAFKNGRVRETLQVSPGKRKLKVEVRGKDRSDTQQVVAEFRPGARRRLDVREGASRGRLTFVWR